MNLSSESLGILSKLRPPFSRSATLLFLFTGEDRVNPGITVEMAASEPAVAPGDGTVTKIYTAVPFWQTSDEVLRRTTVYHVQIDHGGHVTTLVGGMSSVDIIPGQTVSRGDKLGDLFTNQLFFSAACAGKAINPVMIGQHWLPQNGNVVTGQSGKIRFAPDRQARDLSAGVTASWASGVQYFEQPAPAPFLINIDFNGTGSKTGLAATGISSTDYWNVYTPVSFTGTISTACQGSIYTDSASLHPSFLDGSMDLYVYTQAASETIAFGTGAHTFVSGSFASGTESGTYSMAFEVGTHAPAIVIVDAGTESGSLTSSFLEGTYSTPIVDGGTYSEFGSASMTFTVGTYTPLIIDAGTYYEAGSEVMTLLGGLYQADLVCPGIGTTSNNYDNTGIADTEPGYTGIGAKPYGFSNPSAWDTLTVAQIIDSIRRDYEFENGAEILSFAVKRATEAFIAQGIPYTSFTWSLEYSGGTGNYWYVNAAYGGSWNAIFGTFRYIIIIYCPP